MKVQERQVRHGEDRWTVWHLWCPGCELLHQVAEAGTHEGPGEHSRPEWQVTDKTETFTCEPSILVRWSYGPEHVERRCHSFVRGGRWEFLADSTHHLAGQTVPLVDLPEWFTKETERSR